MAEPRNEFTNLTSLGSEAVGEPGKRTFRILADSERSSASLWIEKEQLFQLALAIHRLVATLEEPESEEVEPPHHREAPAATQLDFKVGQLTLGHDASRSLFIIDAHEDETEEDSPALIRLWANKSQVEAFAEEALKNCAAGRPICPLCGRSMDATGHFCPRVNGHRDEQHIP